MAFGQTNAKTISNSVDGVLNPESDNAVKNKTVDAAIKNLIPERAAGAPGAGDYMLYWDADAGEMKKASMETMLAGYRCAAGGSTVTAYGKHTLAPCPLSRQFDPAGMIDPDESRIVFASAGAAAVTTSRRSVCSSAFAHGYLHVRINGTAVKTYDDNGTTLTATTETAYLPVEAGDILDFSIETSGSSSERVRLELVQATVELMPGVSLT